MTRTPESLYSHLYCAVTQILSNITGQFTAYNDGHLAAPDVPGVRVRLVLEIDPAKARGPLPIGKGWQPRPTDPPHEATHPPVATLPAPAAPVQLGLFGDRDEDRR